MRTTTALIRVGLVAALVAVGAARPTGQTRGQTLFGGCPLDAAHLLVGAKAVVFIGEGASTQLARVVRTDGTPHVGASIKLIDADTIFYAATIDDPTEYAAPWTMSFPIPRYRGESDPEVWEAACHEGNRAVPPLLKGGYTRFPVVVPPQVGR